MKIKIGDKWYSPEDQPICIKFEGNDKRNISNMPENNNHYAIFPDDVEMTREEVLNWMED